MAVHFRAFDTMGITVMSLLTLLTVCCLLHCSAAAHKKKSLPSATVVGAVFCDTCFPHGFSKASHFISGASVAVECGPGFRTEVKTNRRGVFRVRLPPEVGRHVESVQSCSVKLVKSSEPSCALASSAVSSELRLKSRRNGIHVFSAGFFTFKPLKQPELCYQKPSLADRKFDLPAFFLPPSLPPNPLQPPLLPPNPLQPPPSILPPNPLQPPPSILPPNPLQPPPSILPPNPLQPSPPPFNLPPIPFLTPPPPPPVFHLPPFPIPPNPLFPGIPPASTSKGDSP